MLSDVEGDSSIVEEASRLKALAGEGMIDLAGRFDFRHLTTHDQLPTQIIYPVSAYPDKIHSLKPTAGQWHQARLLGIKGQYLISDQWVVNVRKFTGYHWLVKAEV